MQLSVVMPVRDAAPFLDEAIESILGQSFADFEFVVRDDDSRDGTRAILRRWAAADRRIRLFESDSSLGPAASSNWVVAQARGDIVARMDGDDVAHPDRLTRQMDVLNGRPGACLVGSLWEGIDEAGRLVRPRDRWPLTRPAAFAPFTHGSIMFRRAAFTRVGGYRLETDFWEDLDLYRRLADVGELVVLPEALYRHRASTLSTRLTSERSRVEDSVDRMYRTVLGRPPAVGEKRLPRVFVSLGSTRLWAGKSPAVLSPLVRRAALRFDRECALVLAWAAWGAVSPRSLRFVLKTLIRLRDRLASGRVPDGRLYTWIGPRPAAEKPAGAPATADTSDRPSSAS